MDKIYFNGGMLFFNSCSESQINEYQIHVTGRNTDYVLKIKHNKSEIESIKDKAKQTLFDNGVSIEEINKLKFNIIK
jgi:hypothetical protein